MRLKNIYIVCKNNLEYIDKLTGASVVNQKSSYIQVSGWGKVGELVCNQLNSIDYLHEKVQRLTSSIPELYRTMDSFRVAPSD